MTSYRDAGVDLDGAAEHVRGISSDVTSTWSDKVIGGFEQSDILPLLCQTQRDGHAKHTTAHNRPPFRFTHRTTLTASYSLHFIIRHSLFDIRQSAFDIRHSESAGSFLIVG